MYKKDGLLMKDWFFIPMFMMLASAMFGGVHMLLNYGFGAFGSLQTRIWMMEGEWAQIASMGIGLYLARILEGSMVGLLDIGGGCMFGVAGFCAGMFGIFGLDWVFGNFITALLAGALVGLAQSAVIMIVRKLMPEGTTSAGSDIMLLVNTKAADFMAPLYLIMGFKYSIPLGIFGVIGGAIMHMRGKNMIGGIILGMFIAAFIFA